MNEEQQPQDVVVEVKEEKKDYQQAKNDFVVFMANPDRPSVAEFAEKYNVPYTTVVHWQDQEWFRDSLIKECKKQLLPHLPTVYRALRNIGEQGSVPALQLFLRQLAVLEPDKIEQKHKVEFPRPILGGLTKNENEGTNSEVQS